DQTSRSPDSQQPTLRDESAATTGQRSTQHNAASAEVIQTAGGGPTTSTASSQTGAEDIPEPNTAAEDEAIVQGETGQFAASQSSAVRAGGEAGTAESGSSAGGDGTTTASSEHLAETGPVPTIAGGLVEGNGTHDCPDGFPIKGNASSRIYHLPGESTYEVTVPEVCFATEEDAAAAGYRPRKR
ncbi:MAG TPA: hypothetical protein VFL82_03805, partial [Thermomicrobiales bacterium]|nr:hypothetical protein [Thermomicrobiales bacterium]